MSKYNKKIRPCSCFCLNIIYILLLVLLLNGCAGKSLTKIDARKIDSTTEDYYLRAGDQIIVKFFITPELNENVVIRPDGKISLQLIDDVRAEGLTSSELDKVLTEKYEKHLNKALITVIVQSFEGQKIFVGGEVGRQGVIQSTGKINALEAIFQSGGFRDEARRGTVVIISRGPDHTPISRVVNLRKALKGKLPESEYLLKPFDIVYVPKTVLSRTDDFMGYLYRIIPNRIWRGFTYETGQNFSVDSARTFYDYTLP